MKIIYLQGVLMDNGEFITNGKSVWLEDKQVYLDLGNNEEFDLIIEKSLKNYKKE